MSHPSHPEDTLFIVVEPDFRFYKKEAESQRSEYEREAAAACRYDDVLDLHNALPKKHQASFQRDFGRWATAQADDQNAPWPMDAEADFTEFEKGLSQVTRTRSFDSEPDSITSFVRCESRHERRT